jgi:hypothetical protein
MQCGQYIRTGVSEENTVSYFRAKVKWQYHIMEKPADSMAQHP